MFQYQTKNLSSFLGPQNATIGISRSKAPAVQQLQPEMEMMFKLDQDSEQELYQTILEYLYQCHPILDYLQDLEHGNNTEIAQSRTRGILSIFQYDSIMKHKVICHWITIKHAVSRMKMPHVQDCAISVLSDTYWKTDMFQYCLTLSFHYLCIVWYILEDRYVPVLPDTLIPVSLYCLIHTVRQICSSIAWHSHSIISVLSDTY